MISLVLALLGGSGPAHATAPDLFGSGARSIGMGGGGVAVTEDGSAANINPAGLYRIRRPTVSMGLQGAFPSFDPIPDLWWDTNRDGTVSSADPPLQFPVDVEPAVGLQFAAGRNVGGKFGIGISGYLPTNRILRFSTFEPELPNYFMYDNRPQRYALAIGTGGEIAHGVIVGAGIDFVPYAHYDLSLTIDASVTGSTDENGEVEDLVGDIVVDVQEMDLDVRPGFAPIVGFQLHLGQWLSPLSGLWIGAAYRGSVGLPIEADLDLQTNLSAEDVGDLEPIVVAAILESGLSLYDHYVPAQLRLGMAWRAEETATAYLDLRWTNWRPMILNVARVRWVDVTSPLVTLDEGAVVDGNDHTFTLKPTWSVRTGSELLLPKWELDNKLRYLRLMARGGFGWEPTPLVSQGDNSALLDADRMMFAAGFGAETWDALELVDGPVRADLYVQYHTLARSELARSASEPTAGYPVEADSIPIGGHILVIGAQWGFDY